MRFENPVDAIARRWGRVNALALLVVVVAAVAVATPNGSTLSMIAFLGAIGLASTSTEFETTPDSEIDETKRLYVEGAISLDEFENRAELILDERAQEIRDVVEEIAGIGPATSAAIAQEFASVDSLRMAKADRLKGIHGIGTSTAEAIVDELGLEPIEQRRRVAESEPADDVDGERGAA